MTTAISAANIWRNPGESGNGRETNNIDDDNNGFVDDFQGWNFANDSNDPSGLASTPTSANHGAHVAGIISAVTDNNNQVSGISWNAKVMPINTAVSGTDNAIGFGYEGILYAADNGAHVINLSWGGEGAPSLFEEDIIDFATEKGAVVVAAAGNDNAATAQFPAGYKNAVSVAATSNSDAKADFSNFGTTVDIAAPGENIRSTFHNGVTGLFSGTSQATPHVAGVIALVRTQHPEWTGLQAAQQVRITADNIDAANPGFVGQLGSGRVNAQKAVTISNLPSIRIADITFIDANGNNVIEKSESVELRINLTNYLVPASNINLTLTESDPFVSITSANANLASLGTLQTTSTPVSFSFNVSSSAPSGRQVNFTLQVSSDEYQDREQFTLLILPTFATHVNNITVSVTNVGRIGFATTEADPRTDGMGFSFNRGPHLLFDGAIICGTGPSTISNAARGIKQPVGSVNQTWDRDFITATNDPLRIITPGSLTDQESITVLEDQLSNTPMNLLITQESFAMTSTPNDNFILLRYTIQNQGQTALTNFHFGLFFDWDIGDAFENTASYDAARRMGITSDASTFVGVASLGSVSVHYRAIDNNTISHLPDVDGFTDVEKWQAISGGLSALTAGPADVSHVLANGPLSIAAGESVTLDYALLAANSLAELRNTADAAKALWNQLITDVEDQPAPGIPERFSLHQNYPNPFNPSTEIRYDLSQPVEVVELAIYNLLGQRVRMLLNARQPAGFHTIQWDGKNDAGATVASGSYLYELRAGGFVQTRKMMLLR